MSITKRWVSNGLGNPFTIYLSNHHWGAETGNKPTTDRSKLGTKRHILTDKNCIPLYAVISTLPGFMTVTW